MYMCMYISMFQIQLIIGILSAADNDGIDKILFIMTWGLRHQSPPHVYMTYSIHVYTYMYTVHVTLYFNYYLFSHNKRLFTLKRLVEKIGFVYQQKQYNTKNE